MDEPWFPCPSCGALVEVISSQASSICAHCGSKIISPEVVQKNSSPEKKELTGIVRDHSSPSEKNGLTAEERKRFFDLKYLEYLRFKRERGSPYEPDSREFFERMYRLIFKPVRIPEELTGPINDEIRSILQELRELKYQEMIHMNEEASLIDRRRREADERRRERWYDDYSSDTDPAGGGKD